MKTLLSRWAWVRIVEGVLLMIVGLLTGILGGIKPNELSTALGIVIAVFLFIDGGLTLFANIVDTKKIFSLDAILGAVFIALGVILCMPEGINSIKAILAIFVAVLLLAAGANYLIKAIYSIKSKQIAGGWITLFFIVSLVSLTLGVLCLIYREQQTLNVIYIVLGTTITIAGLFDIIVAVRAIKERNNEIQPVENNVNNDIVYNDTGKNEIVVKANKNEVIVKENKNEVIVKEDGKENQKSHKKKKEE